MSERQSVTQAATLGLETTKGTAVPSTVLVKSAKLMFQPKPEIMEHREQGGKFPAKHLVTSEQAEGSLDGQAMYDELGYWLASALCKPVTELVSTGVYRHTFTPKHRTSDDARSFTVEYGDEVRSHKVAYAMLSELGFKFSRKDLGVSGTFFSRKLQDGVTRSPGVDDVQTLTVSGTPTGGTYKIRYEGATTAALNHNAAAAAIQAALEALATIGTGNVAVSGSGPFTITGDGDLAGRLLSLIEKADNSLTGGSAPDISVAHTTPGGYTEHPLVPILPESIAYYYADTIAGLAAAKMDKAFLSDVKIGGRWKPTWFQDGSTDFASHAEGDTKAETMITLEADSNGMALLGNARSGARKFFRVKSSGPTISGGNSYLFQLTKACEVSSVNGFKDQDGVFATEFGLSAVFDPTWGKTLEVVLVNTVASY